MIINHNMNAMNAHRNMIGNTANAGKSMEKLSSGLRINRAGDDAAGLAISEKMRGQIRGLDQASRNAQDGISLIQTAEGALNETHSILQRMRELAVQASNDTNTGVDRGEIQKEINQLTSEVNRIGNTTEFNTMKLLDGSRDIETTTTTTAAITKDVTTIKDGLGGNVTVSSSMGVTISGTADDKAAWKAAVSGGIVIGTDASADEAIDWTDIDLAATTKATLSKDADGNLAVKLEATDKTGNAFVHEATFNTDTMKAAATDGKYTVDFHGVSFELDLAEFENASNSTNVELDLTVAVDNTATDVQNTYGLDHGFTNSAEGAKFNSFTIDKSNPALVGIETIDIQFDGTDVIVKGYDADGNTVLNDKTTPATAPTAAGDTFAYSENGIDFEFELIADSSGADITSFTTNKLDVKDLVAQKGTETQVVTAAKTETVVDADDSLVMQIGANKNQALKVTINDMRSASLNISSTTTGGNFTATEANQLTDVSTEGAAEYALDMSTSEKATNAIDIYSSAIEQVSAERSKLGAYQNRLEHTIANLGTASENLTSAESRVRDVDMAKEMMTFSKNNILSQAAQAMLAQANSQPQGVLQLLR